VRKTADIMGMPIVLDIVNCDNEQIFLAVFKELQQIDDQFSPYKIDSELSRFKRGELKAPQLSIGMQDIMKACLDWESQTHGYFSARYKGGFDPLGYVKGWAMAQAAKSLRILGFEDFCLSAGGDMLASSLGSKIWKIGLQNPERKDAVLGIIPARNLAVATSGNYERGNHIIDPKTGLVPDFFKSLTVIGPDIITTDVYATAAFAMGKEGLNFVDAQPGYDVFAVGKDRNIYMSTGMKALLEASREEERL
jgi:thiamine biosynthesis lipoprotein